MQRFETVAEGEGDAFEHRLRQRRAVCLVAEPGEGAADRGIVVRRALAGEIGQEGDACGRPEIVAEFGRQVAGAVQTVSGSAFVAAISPSRAAPKAAPKSPSAGMSTGMPSAVAIDFSQ